MAIHSLDGKLVKTWAGEPGDCDLCGRPFTTIFIDGAMQRGSWANMCLMCFEQHGVGIGTGRGQKYEKTRCVEVLTVPLSGHFYQDESSIADWAAENPQEQFNAWVKIAG